MNVDVSGVQAKLDRANGHIADLRLILEPITKAATESIAREDDGDPSKIAYRVTNVPVLDPQLPTIVGDALFNLRSALDHFAWQLVLFDGGNPDENTQFPIYESRTTKKGNPREVTIRPGIKSRAILDALDEVQPYKRLDYNDTPEDDTLAVVKRLCNTDKHRLLLTMIHSIDKREPGWWGLDEGIPNPKFGINTGPLRVGYVVARFDFLGTPAPRDFNPHLSLVVSLHEGGGWVALENVADLLAGLHSNIVRDLNWQFIAPILGVPHLTT